MLTELDLAASSVSDARLGFWTALTSLRYRGLCNRPGAAGAVHVASLSGLLSLCMDAAT